MASGRAGLFGPVFCIFSLFLCFQAKAQEFRALWVDAFGPGYKTAAQVTQLVSDLRTGNFNAVVVEVRKRGDAYYNSNFEPKALDIDSDFDPLADLISKAHDTSGGRQRIAVHAWIVTYPIWRVAESTNNAPADHVIRQHQDWLTITEGGARNDGSNFVLDPAHPDVQRHTFNVCMDIVSRYDVDGLNFDYVRYSGNNYGYNPVAVARFNARFGRAGQPSRTDSEWLQFRRDQVSGLVRKVFLSSMAIKPQLIISADTITWAPYPASIQAWTNSSAAYTSVLQDWRSWMEEGMLDLNIPMTYFRMHTHPTDWFGWCNFIRDHQYGRQAAIGPGLYLNTFSNTLFQMRHTREPSPAGNTAIGVIGYDYGQISNDGTSRSTFLAALTQTNTARFYDPNPVPLFVNEADIPAMPWKTNPTKGHMKGFVHGYSTNEPVDGANFTLAGPVNRAFVSDATGFFGSVNLPPGSYTVQASATGVGTGSSNFTVIAGAVTTVNLTLSANDTTPPVISNVRVEHITDHSAAILWSTDEPADSVAEYGVTTDYGSIVAGTGMVHSHFLEISNLAANTLYHFRVSSTDASNNAASSGDLTFQTNPSGVVSDLIIDNPAASVAGAWSVGNSATGKFGPDYRFKAQGSGSAYLEFTPRIMTAGNYQVYEWHSVGGNRTLSAPHQITHGTGAVEVAVNQRLDGGRWNLLGTFAFNTGASGYVRIYDDFNETTNVVIADAIKFVFVPDAPQIVTHPTSRSVTAGANASFGVGAIGSPPLAYQWQFNGTNLPGATSSAITLTSVDRFDAGTYRALVSNLAGSVFSSNAVLTVEASGPPAITGISTLPDQRVLISAAGDAGFTYTLVGSTNFVDWDALQSLNPQMNQFEFLESSTNAPRQFFRVRLNQ